MARSTSASTRKPPLSFTATLHLRGQDFPFRLFTRPVRLGEYGTIQYFWMDSSQLRSLRSHTAAANFRSIVGFWGAAMQEMELHRDMDQQVHYVLSVCYGLLSSSKSLQNIFRDAYLAPDSVRVEATSLSDETRQRIHEVALSRDRFQVQQELKAALGGFEPPAKVMPLLQEALRHWVGKGVRQLRQQGNDGLEQFLKEVDYWLGKYRKRSSRWLRHFLDLFAYECKAAFYTCYANAWVGLIPWLREHRGLDPLSERFLRFWHNQNQPIEVPHGQTPAGILYPTRHDVRIAETDGRGGRKSHVLRLKTEQIGPSHVRDVFCGQVLSLHPLSGFLMKDRALSAVAGRFFATEAHDRALVRGQACLCSAYWELVETILTAAHLYRQALSRQAEGRGTRCREAVEEMDVETKDGVSEATLLEDYAVDRKLCCPACGATLQLLRYEPAEADKETFRAQFSCRDCRQTVPLTIAGLDLENWIRSSD